MRSADLAPVRPAPARRRPWPVIFALAAGLGALPGCPDAGAPPEETTLGPVVAGAELAMADLERSELVVLTTELGEAADLRRVGLSEAPSALAALPDERAVLALSSEGASLDVVAMPEGTVDTYALGAPFEALSVAPDATAVMAWFPPGAGSTVFHNGNEMAFVDLERGPGDEGAVTRRTLSSLGGAPTSVFVSPKVGSRRYAFVLSAGHVAVLDLTRPATRERSVPLVSLNAPTARTPVSVEFGVDSGGTLWGVVTTQEAYSAYALRVAEAAPTEPEEPPFDVTLNQLAGFSPGGDVALVTLPDGRLVAFMVSPVQGSATLTELSSGASKSLSLGAGVNRLETYEDLEGRPVAVAFRAGATEFHVVDLAAIETKKDKSFRTRFAYDAIDSLLPVPGTALFFAFHPSTSRAVSVIDADTDRITPFEQTGFVRQVVLDESLGRVYLLTRLASVDYLVSVQLDNLHPQRATIHDGAERILLSPSGQTVIAVSDLPGGRYTLWPALATSDEHARAVPAFLLSGVLDRLTEEN